MILSWPLCRLICTCIAVVSLLFLETTVKAGSGFPPLTPPNIGDHHLNILSPQLLELVRINTKPESSPAVDSWDWVASNGELAQLDYSRIQVLVNGQSYSVTGAGFKRRPVYAPLWLYEIRVDNRLYLQLNQPIPEGATVKVKNSDGSLWPTNFNFSLTADRLRLSEVIHVNQEGYLPSHPKKAIVGYYLGNLGEMPIPSRTFQLVDAATGAQVYQGNLTERKDYGFTFTPVPYQTVYEADFTSVTTPGQYRVLVPGLGASLPFRIDEGAAMNLARTYAIGMLEQRSGFDVAMPYTRFTHAADHTAPVLIPTNNSAPYVFTWNTIADYATQTNENNPPQTAPRLLSPADQLYPFVNQGPVDLTGGHFEAANYSKVPWNGAQIVHVLMFAVDSLDGVSGLDNLGIPESGDGISDALQEAKFEADALAKMQDADGGFYYMIHPVTREYENNVLPENGDQQVAWPKNTATTAASVAALAQCASSPAFKAAYPAVASNYWSKAMLGWRFLTNAIAAHGEAGAYQRIMHFDDWFTHNDDLAWAACELYLATTNVQYKTQLEHWMPDPTSPDTKRWGWWGMYASYGNAIRSYAAAVKSGRLTSAALNQDYLVRCQSAITNYANDVLLWSKINAYGTSFPEPTKASRSAGWYFSTEQAFDLVVANSIAPDEGYLDAIWRNINYEGGCNPVNVSFVTGLGWKRQTQVVDQYSDNDHRILPKIGVPIANIQFGFTYTWTYGTDLAALCFPSDGGDVAPYAFYDRWSDFWNVSTEASTANTVRSFATTLWLAAQTGTKSQPWHYAVATITSPAQIAQGLPVTLTLNVPGLNIAGAKIIWEVQEQNPTFGTESYTFTPSRLGAYWAEAEVQMPDGRRAFAKTTLNVGSPQDLQPLLSGPQKLADRTFKVTLSGTPNAAYIVQSSTNLLDWISLSTNTLPASGSMELSDTTAAGLPFRFYRVLKQ